MNRTLLWILSLLTVALTFEDVASAAVSPKFGMKWRTLIGEWKGESASDDGAVCGFHLDLSDQIIVRTNHAKLAAAADKQANIHDDLMVIYPAVAQDKGRAIYFDNEGHVIEYEADWSADGTALTFLSKPGMGPQFRLTYKKTDPNTFSVTFEMTPPGQSTFKVYTSGKIRRERG